MTDFLYLTFIFPLESFMKLVLEGIFESTGNPSLALIGVSLAVTMGSLPLYHIAERWQDNERAIQKRLKPKIAEFKSVFKGAVLNAYVHTLYRQNRYHPIFAVRTSFGLLIQIPFFFAAYRLLSNYHVFDGIQTFLFSDLSKPDRLLKLGSISINIMPFVMTGINLASASVYGKKLVLKDKVQLYAIAAFFLIALYNSPSALLLYWTCNNIFSLAKNTFYRLIYKKGELNSPVTKKRTLSFPRLKLAYNSRVSFWARLALTAIALGLLFFFYQGSKIKEARSLLALFFIFEMLFAACLLTCFELFAAKAFKGRNRLIFLYSLTILTALGLLSLWLFNIHDVAKIRRASVYVLATLSIFDLLRVILDRIILFITTRNLIIHKSRNTVFYLAIANLGALVFFSGPLMLLSSGEVTDFDQKLFYYLSFMIMLLACFVFISLVIYAFLNDAQKSVYIYLLIATFAYALLNSTVFVGDYGEMTHFVMDNDFKIEKGMSLLNIAAGVALVVLIGLVVYFRKARYVAPFLAICLVSQAVLALSEGYSFYNTTQTDPAKWIQASASVKDKKENEAKAEKQRKDKIPQKLKTLEKDFVFSSTKKNVLIIMLDRFMGGYFEKVLDLLPELKSRLDGFTWYPNSLSVLSHTIAGEPSVMGGWDYTPYEIHHKRTDVLLKTKLDETMRVMPYNFGKAGYDVAIYSNSLIWMNRDNGQYIENARFSKLDGKYYDLWMKQYKKELVGDDTRLKLGLFGLFRVAPPAARTAIYDKGRWLMESQSTKDVANKKLDKFFVSFKETNNERLKAAAKSWSALEYLPNTSEASSSAPSQFYYFSNMFTHEPYIATSNFNVEIEKRIYYPRKVFEEFGKDPIALQHLYTNTAALRMLSEWFEWMKRNGVYDNTRIIIVSDHGRYIYDPSLNTQTIAASKKRVKAGFFHNFLLIKDFGERGQVKQNQEFMTTCDVPYLSMKDLMQGFNPYTGNPIAKRNNKFPFHLYYVKPWLKLQKKYKYSIVESFVVNRPPVLDPSKWKRFNDK